MLPIYCKKWEWELRQTQVKSKLELGIRGKHIIKRNGSSTLLTNRRRKNLKGSSTLLW